MRAIAVMSDPTFMVRASVIQLQTKRDVSSLRIR